ncbi:MAG: SPASM domain-containing protein [Planctomycetota bacterium]
MNGDPELQGKDFCPESPPGGHYKNTYFFGNINGDESVMNIWKGKKAVDFRKHFNAGCNDYYLYKDCTYKNMVYEDCIIEKLSFKR